MKKFHKNFFEFLCELIDIQIKKYAALAQIGVGPDAAINSFLVFKEVEELFQLAEQLLSMLEGDSQFATVFDQVRFFIEQEYRRGRAGWLIDENNIHTPEMHRLSQQVDILKRLAIEAGINTSSPALPVTAFQQQCQHDSYAISFYILDLAVQLKDNPEMDLAGKIPAHAARIVRHHARAPEGRYHQAEIAREIADLHYAAKTFLEGSTLAKSTQALSKELTELKRVNHVERLERLLSVFQSRCPDSVLFTSEHSWYHPGKLKQPVNIGLQNAGLFKPAAAGLVLAAGVTYLAYSLLSSRAVSGPLK